MNKMECPYLNKQCSNPRLSSQIREQVCQTEYHEQCHGYQFNIPWADLTKIDFKEIMGKLETQVELSGGQR